ncbi:MAG TPA: hypothetical protein EYG02_05215 [Henriciella marina]|uniref:hypothetical protein n=1 Tax=Henriciella sp. TaxID=1968823 RepID=UPI0017906568|nr:hypothetical protein [Henriciella sp.]HIG21955.1 hypothetical protein [Henriciella sp.]HIK64411.1 hypothetical protein [Henriciella marina]
MKRTIVSRFYMMSTFCVSSLLAGCMTVAPLEPVKNAPAEFRGDNTVAVEFVSPMLVGARCAQRGAHIFGVPQLNSMGCGDGRMITMPNPCQTITSGWYARLLCHELAHANGWSRTHEGGSYLPDDMSGIGAQTASADRPASKLSNLTPASQSPQAIAAAEARREEAVLADQDAAAPAPEVMQASFDPQAEVMEAPQKLEFSSHVKLASFSEELSPAIKSSTTATSRFNIGLRPRTEAAPEVSEPEPTFTLADPKKFDLPETVPGASNINFQPIEISMQISSSAG